jgi:hypothetical protein
VAPRGDLIARLEACPPIEPFAVPATSRDVAVSAKSSPARHIQDVTPAGGLEPRPTLGHRSIEDRPDTPNAPVSSKNLDGLTDHQTSPAGPDPIFDGTY